MSVKTFDFIVVGAGSAGAVIAARLSENPRRSVLLVEAGPDSRNPWLAVPIGFARTFQNPRFNWMYKGEPEPFLEGRRMFVPRGKGLGGSSAINGMVMVRGQQRDFDHWRQLGNEGWSYADVLPFFRKYEDYDAGDDDPYHGRGGPIRTMQSDWRNPLTEAFIEGAGELGIPRNPDINGATQDGAGYFQLSQRDGLRSSTARGHLRAARRRPNLEIVTEALVEKVIIAEGRATGIVYTVGGERTEARAGREVIVSGGSVNSPQLLQLSGIGPTALLREHGIDVVADLPGVGENLQDHYSVPIQARVNVPWTLNHQLGSLPRQAAALLRYAISRKGPLTVAAGVVGVFARTRPELEGPDIQIHFFPFAREEAEWGVRMHPFSAVSAIVDQHVPLSRGYVRIRSADPRDPPVICGNYLEAPEDRETLVAGLRLLRSLFNTKAMSPYVEQELVPGKAVDSDEELLAYARAKGDSSYHLAGTCRMGPSTSRMNVVDDRLRVHGVAGLRVADASIMPVIVSGNTNATAIMLGEKAAAMVEEDARTSG